MTRTVTMDLAEYDAQRDENRRLEARVKELEESITKVKLENPKTAELAQLVRESITIISFATANLSPEIVRNWPYKSLRVVAEGMQHLPDSSPFDVELAREYVKIAAECEAWEKKRAARGDVYVPPPAPNGTPSYPYGYQASKFDVPPVIDPGPTVMREAEKADAATRES